MVGGTVAMKDGDRAGGGRWSEMRCSGAALRAFMKAAAASD